MNPCLWLPTPNHSKRTRPDPLGPIRPTQPLAPFEGNQTGHQMGLLGLSTMQRRDNSSSSVQSSKNISSTLKRSPGAFRRSLGQIRSNLWNAASTKAGVEAPEPTAAPSTPRSSPQQSAACWSARHKEPLPTNRDLPGGPRAQKHLPGAINATVPTSRPATVRLVENTSGALMTQNPSAWARLLA